MIGDDVVSDVGGALKAGLRGILVRTGKFVQSDLETDICPTYVAANLADAVDEILSGN